LRRCVLLPVDFAPGSAGRHAGATELCNGVDDDCSSGGGADAAEDVDGDLHTDPGTRFWDYDCSGTAERQFPGAGSCVPFPLRLEPRRTQGCR
jgi:hypothetical protein